MVSYFFLQSCLSPFHETTSKVVSAEHKVLAMCGQSMPIAFDDYFDDK